MACVKWLKTWIVIWFFIKIWFVLKYFIGRRIWKNRRKLAEIELIENTKYKKRVSLKKCRKYDRYIRR